MKSFTATFFGTKSRKGQLTKQIQFVRANEICEVREVLESLGYLKIHSLKIKESKE